jgi:hypothetical protein
MPVREYCYVEASLIGGESQLTGSCAQPTRIRLTRTSRTRKTPTFLRSATNLEIVL